MSCDNLRHNGDTARKAIVVLRAGGRPGRWATGSTRIRGLSRTAWWTASPPRCPSPCGRSLNEQQRRRGQALPALGEDFMQFVLEDHFSNGTAGPRQPSGVELRRRRGRVRDHEAAGAQRVPHDARLPRVCSRGTASCTKPCRTSGSSPCSTPSFQDHDVIPFLEAPRRRLARLPTRPRCSSASPTRPIGRPAAAARPRRLGQVPDLSRQDPREPAQGRFRPAPGGLLPRLHRALPRRARRQG